MGCSSGRVARISPAVCPTESLRENLEATLSAQVRVKGALQKALSKDLVEAQQNVGDPSRLEGDALESVDPANSIIIFDWDDTLYPTTWVRALQSNGSQGGVRHTIDEPKEALRLFTEVVVELLAKAQCLGKVVIVTNASRGWVDYTCTKVMPEARTIIRGLPVFYAQEFLTDAERVRWSRQKSNTEAKVRAMRAAISAYLPHEGYKNVLSVGDSSFERDAVRKVVGALPSETHPNVCRAKSLKMLERPNLESMGLQLSLASIWLTSIMHIDEDLDIVFDGSAKA